MSILVERAMRFFLAFLLCLAAFGCKSKSEKEKKEDAWREEFLPILRKYEAIANTGGPEIDAKSVKGRRVLITGLGPRPDETKLFEAHSANEVGIVVVSRSVSDLTPSRTYENGKKGYGGEVEIAAFAHPEGKRLALLKTRCTAPYLPIEIERTGGHCTATEQQLLDFGLALFNGRPPLYSDAWIAASKGFAEILARYQNVADAPAADAPSIKGRKLLLYADHGSGPDLFLNESLLPLNAYAATPDEVGAFALLRMPTKAARGELLLIAHPEGKVVARQPINCVSLDQARPELMDGPESCLPDGARVQELLTSLL